MSSRGIKWTDFPEKRVFSIEYSGEAQYGKTHCMATYPNVAMCDTIAEGEGHLIMKKFNNPKWFRVKNFDDFRRFVKYCIANPKIESIAIDSGSDLRGMAEQEYLRESGKKSVYIPGKGGFLYRHVDKKIDDLIQEVKKAQKYLLVSSRLRDEWIKIKGATSESETDSYSTGRRIRSGYHKFPFGLSVLLELVNGIKDEDDRVHFDSHIFGRVIKNRFLHKRVQKPFIFDPTYHGLVEESELFTPWCGNYNEKCDLNTCARCREFKAKDVMDEAKKYLIEIGTLQEVTLDEKAK